MEKEQPEDMEAQVSELQRQIEELLETRKRKGSQPAIADRTRITSECDDTSRGKSTLGLCQSQSAPEFYFCWFVPRNACCQIAGIGRIFIHMSGSGNHM